VCSSLLHEWSSSPRTIIDHVVSFFLRLARSNIVLLQCYNGHSFRGWTPARIAANACATSCAVTRRLHHFVHRCSPCRWLLIVVVLHAKDPLVFSVVFCLHSVLSCLHSVLYLCLHCPQSVFTVSSLCLQSKVIIFFKGRATYVLCGERRKKIGRPETCVSQ
jgi:hypothetical protein